MRSQAYKIANYGTPDALSAAVGEFKYLEKHIENLGLNDTDGTYLIKVLEPGDQKRGTVQFPHLEVGGERMLDHYYIAPSGAKHLFEHSYKQIFCIDATFLDGPLKGYFFLAVSKDANNQLVLLAFGQYHTENARNWATFCKQVATDYPQCSVINCDKQKGLDSIKDCYGIRHIMFARCVRHYVENVQSAAHKSKFGNITEDMLARIWGMAKAATKQGYLYHKKKLTKLNRHLAEWTHQRRSELASYKFLKAG